MQLNNKLLVATTYILLGDLPKSLRHGLLQVPKLMTKQCSEGVACMETHSGQGMDFNIETELTIL